MNPQKHHRKQPHDGLRILPGRARKRYHGGAGNHPRDEAGPALGHVLTPWMEKVKGDIIFESLVRASTPAANR